MYQSTRGKNKCRQRRQNQAGFTLTELLWIVVIGAAFGAIGWYLYDVSRGERFSALASATHFARIIGQQRNNARVGFSSEWERSVDLGKTFISDGVEFLESAPDKKQFTENYPVLTKADRIVFDAQSARVTSGGKWGTIYLHDTRTAVEIILVVPQSNGPTVSYIKYPGQDKFSLMRNLLY